MFSHEQIIKMSPEEFSKNWKSGEIQDSALKLLGAREMTAEDEETLAAWQESEEKAD